MLNRPTFGGHIMIFPTFFVLLPGFVSLPGNTLPAEKREGTLFIGHPHPILPVRRLFLQELINEVCNLRFVNLSSNDNTVLVNKNVLRDISYIVHSTNLVIPEFKV